MTYTCTGSVRGSCGHAHRTESGALRCLEADRRACRAMGGYSDRVIVASDGETLVTEPERRASPVTDARELVGLSVQELAAARGVTRDAVYQLERRLEDASLSAIRESVEACGCDLVVTVRESER